MKTLLCVLCALVVLAFVAAPVEAGLFGRGGNMGMVCNKNVVPNPPAANAKNLTESQSTKVMKSLNIETAEPILAANKESKPLVDLKALQALNENPANRAAISNVAAK